MDEYKENLEKLIKLNLIIAKQSVARLTKRLEELQHMKKDKSRFKLIKGGKIDDQ